MTMTTTRLTGHAAINAAETFGLTLSKHADPTEGARDGLTVAEAREIAREDASLIWIEAPDLASDEEIADDDGESEDASVEALVAGRRAGEADVLAAWNSYPEGHERARLLRTVGPRADGWDAAARDARAHEHAGVDEEHAESYYAGYLAGALACAAELLGVGPGARVEAGVGEDHDTGRVRSINGRRATVDWDSGVATTDEWYTLAPA